MPKLKPEEWSYKHLSGEWVRLPVALLQIPDLTTVEAVILSVLIDRAINKPDCINVLSRPELSRYTGVSIATIARALDHFRQINLIKADSDGRKLYYKLTGARFILPPKEGGFEGTENWEERLADWMEDRRNYQN